MIEILSIFKHTLKVEVILGALLHAGIERKDITAVSLERPGPDAALSSAGPSESEREARLELPFILATAWAVIGAGVGYRLYFGPVIWGIGASIAGFLSGYLISCIFQFLKKGKKIKQSEPGVVLIIHCREDQRQRIEQLLSENEVLGLTVFQY
ncbi:hypothetical protein [Sporolactobacillus vineae]|uniref:hypothetical protein n=1 Tax=Sporolactobacillus vineae TaxID=444463 RepID=UPI000288D527|nr:hypothetical protein [Sporolactobacillus vineae]